MSRKVLVVDDEKLIVKGIRFNLEQDGMVLMTEKKRLRRQRRINTILSFWT